MSFIPFLGGKRVCLGKTFAENAFKVIVPLILKAYKDLEFVDLAHYKQKPPKNVTLVHRPVIKIRLIKN
jgi:cytochrome P450